MKEELALVTGGSGFVGAHCIIQLLEAGYRVRTTVRSPKREPDVRSMIKSAGVDPGDRLSFVVADLTADSGWAEAAAGCSYVLHVASPFPAERPKHEDDLIIPAREGALRVLRAARDAGVKRVVLTSSFVAIGYGHKSEKLYTEEDWTDLSGEGVTAYGKSKTLAEQAAWNFIKQEGGGLELSVVNPVGIFGPALGPDFSTSIQIVQMLLNRAMPAVPRLKFGVVDVRDVASLHLLAMTNPAAAGERFLAIASEVMACKDMSKLLKAELGPVAARTPTGEFPDWLLRLLALVSPTLGLVAPELGKERNASSAKAEKLLGWKPRSAREAVLASGESLVKLGLVKRQ